MDILNDFALPTTQYFVWIGVKAYTGIWNAILVKPYAPMVLLALSSLFIAGKNLSNPKAMVQLILKHLLAAIIILVCVFPQKEINITDIRSYDTSAKSTVLEEMGLNNSSGKFPYFLWYYWSAMQNAIYYMMNFFDLSDQEVGKNKYSYNNEDITKWESAYQNIGKEFLSFYKNDYLPALSDYLLMNTSLTEKERLDMALYPDDQVINWMTEAGRPLKIRNGGYQWIVKRKSYSGMSLSEKMDEYGKFLQEKYIKLYPNATAREHLIKQIHKQFIENNTLSEVDSRKSVAEFNQGIVGEKSVWGNVTAFSGWVGMGILDIFQSLMMLIQKLIFYISYDFLPICQNGAFLIFFLGMGLIIPLSFMPGWWSIYFKWMMSIFFLWTWTIGWKITDFVQVAGMEYYHKVTGSNDVFMDHGGLDFTVGVLRILVPTVLASLLFSGPMGLIGMVSTVFSGASSAAGSVVQIAAMVATGGASAAAKGVSATAKVAQKAANMVKK